jgi:DnaJ-class molecular chaperone
MLVKVFVETPVKLTASERELLEKLDKIMADKANNSSENFFKKAADFFKN